MLVSTTSMSPRMTRSNAFMHARTNRSPAGAAVDHVTETYSTGTRMRETKLSLTSGILILTAFMVTNCGGGGGTATANGAPPPAPPTPPVIIATSEHSAIYSDSFANNPFTDYFRGTGSFLEDPGIDVFYTPGQLSLVQTVPITSFGINSAEFWPSQKITVKLSHMMTPNLTSESFFLPSIDFRIGSGNLIYSLQWGLSQYGDTDCNQGSAFDRVLIRTYTLTSCALSLSAITATSLFNREITSTITFDKTTGLLTYNATTSELFGPATPIATHTFTIPSTQLGQIDGINEIRIRGAGLSTGNRIDIRRIDVLTTNDTTKPAMPIGRTATEQTPNGLISSPLSPTSQWVDNFAARWYWEEPDADGQNKNHIGSDIALTNGGRSTVDLGTAERQVMSLCDNGTVIDAITTDSSGLTNVLLVDYPNCGGRRVRVYYGHMHPTVSIGSVVSRQQVIGSIANWGNNSHLHLTIDTMPSRNLVSTQYYICGYTINSRSEVTDFANCIDSTASGVLGSGQALIRVGWGKLTIISHRPVGSTSSVSTNLFTTKSALTSSSDPRFRFMSIWNLLNGY